MQQQITWDKTVQWASVPFSALSTHETIANLTDWLRDTNLIFSNSYCPPWFKNLYNWICYDLFSPSLFVHVFLVAIIHPLRSAKKFKSGLPPDLGYLPFWSDAVPDTWLALLTMMASHSLSKCKFLECFHISQCPIRKPVISLV